MLVKCFSLMLWNKITDCCRHARMDFLNT